MGRTTMTSSHCTPAGPKITGGKMTLVAANHDKVFIEYEATAGGPGPDGIIVADIDFEIVDGTGRFDGATGGGKMTAFITFEGFDDFEWPGRWVWKGKIGY